MTCIACIRKTRAVIRNTPPPSPAPCRECAESALASARAAADAGQRHAAVFYLMKARQFSPDDAEKARLLDIRIRFQQRRISMF